MTGAPVLSKADREGEWEGGVTQSPAMSCGRAGSGIAAGRTGRVVQCWKGGTGHATSSTEREVGPCHLDVRAGSRKGPRLGPCRLFNLNYAN